MFVCQCQQSLAFHVQHEERPLLGDFLVDLEDHAQDVRGVPVNVDSEFGPLQVPPDTINDGI